MPAATGLATVGDGWETADEAKTACDAGIALASSQSRQSRRAEGVVRSGCLAGGPKARHASRGSLAAGRSAGCLAGGCRRRMCGLFCRKTRQKGCRGGRRRARNVPVGSLKKASTWRTQHGSRRGSPIARRSFEGEALQSARKMQQPGLEGDDKRGPQRSERSQRSQRSQMLQWSSMSWLWPRQHGRFRIRRRRSCPLFSLFCPTPGPVPFLANSILGLDQAERGAPGRERREVGRGVESADFALVRQGVDQRPKEKLAAWERPAASEKGAHTMAAWWPALLFFRFVLSDSPFLPRAPLLSRFFSLALLFFGCWWCSLDPPFPCAFASQSFLLRPLDWLFQEG